MLLAAPVIPAAEHLLHRVRSDSSERDLAYGSAWEATAAAQQAADHIADTAAAVTAIAVTVAFSVCLRGGNACRQAC